MKRKRLSTAGAVHAGSDCNLVSSSNVRLAEASSLPESSNEYAVDKVDKITSLAANPPINAIFACQGNPAYLLTDSSAVPTLPPIEYFNASI